MVDWNFFVCSATAPSLLPGRLQRGSFFQGSLRTMQATNVGQTLGHYILIRPRPPDFKQVCLE